MTDISQGQDSSIPQEAPDVDSLFPTEHQDVDTLFPPDVERERTRQTQLGTSPIQDLLFSNDGPVGTRLHSAGRMLDAFGQGVKRGWGSEPLGLSDESEKYLKEHGVFNDYAAGHASIAKAANEVLIRPAVMALDGFLRAGSAAVSGLQGVAADQGEQAKVQGVGGPSLWRDIAALPEAFPTFGGELGTPHPPAVAPALRFVEQARDLKVIGEGEAGYLGTAVTTEPKTAGVAEVSKTIGETPKPEQVTGEIAPAEQTVSTAVTATPEPAPDVHAVARQVDPETFKVYDALDRQRETFREHIESLRTEHEQEVHANAPQTAEIDKLTAKIDDPETTPRLRKKYEASRAPLLEARDAYLDENLKGESADIATVRQRLQETDYQMRDLAPKVSQAYREARERVPEQPAEAVQESPAAAPEPAAQSEQAPQAAPEASPEPAKAEAAAPPIEQQRTAIVSDVAKKLIAAGRPAEEANAAAAISAAYWETRAERFKGAKGTAEEMYRAEAPEITKGKAAKAKLREMELAQNVTNPQTTTPEFQKWFGDSKVVGPNSEPVVTYHGTARAGFSEFDTYGGNYGLMGSGGYFTEDPAIASAYTKKGAEQMARKGRDPSQGVYPTYLSIKNPIDMDAPPNLGAWKKVFGEYLDDERVVGAKTNEAVLREVESALTDEMIPKHEGAEIIQDGLRSMGFDGVTHIGGGRLDSGGAKHRVWIAFDPEQIKSAIGNAGTFDPTSPNILNQEARGRIRIRDEGRNTITLLKDANASTFIHETGHDWLDRLMKDAKDGQAPAELRTDATTVLKWLGVEDAEGIKTKQHEKFARGFETYMREGRAPTQALADVFAKFRDWLVKIYRTAASLKAPISDDIRGVFDRMLASKPEKTVIAAEPEAAKTLAERHEAHVETTPPEKAGDVAGTVQSERDTLAARQLPEDQDVRLANIDETTGRREARSAESDRDGNAAQPDSGEVGGNTPTGTVGKGGSEVAAEGAGSLPEAKSANVKSEPPASAGGTIEGSTSALVDKAGNIRLDNLGTPEDVNRAIRDAAEANNEFFEGRRGVITDGQVVDLADALGMDAGMLSTRKLGEAYNAEQIVAARKLLIQSATNVRDAMVKAAEGSDADVLAYAEIRERHRMIQEQVSGITAEAGRALRAFRALEGSKEAQQIGDFLQANTGKTLYQLRKEAQLGLSLDSPAQVSRFIHETSKPTFKDMVIEAWMAFLLSGLKTHVANIMGNSLSAIWRPLETATAAGIGKARSLITGSEDRVLLGEASAELFGMVQGSKEGIVAAYKAFKTEDPQFTGTRQLEQQHGGRAIPSATVNILGHEMEIGGKQVRIGLRALTAEDELFKGVAFRGDINRQAYSMAVKEGLEGEMLSARTAELSMSPTDAMVEQAKKVAEYQTFQTPLGKTGRAVQQFANSHILAKMVVPFVRTPINLLKYAAERTPLGLFAQEVRDNLSGKNGAVARDTQIARMALGTMIGVTTFEYAAQGLITGGGPADPQKKAIMMADGWQPYSMRIGEMYYAYNRLDPFSVIMGLSADYYEIGTALGSEHLEKEHLPSMIFAAISKNVLERAALKGPSDLIQTLSDPERYGKNYIKGMVGTVIPAFVAQSAQTMDPIVRETRTVLDGLKSRIPYLSETLMPKRDVWGEPITREGGLGPDIAAPILERRIKNDPVNRALIEGGYFPGKLDRKIRGVELTDQQYDDYARVAGRMAKTRLNAIVGMPGFNFMPKSTREELMRNAVTSSRETARSMIMMQSPDIMKKAMDAKVGKLRGTGATVH